MTNVSLIICLKCESFEFYKERLDLRKELHLDGIETIVVNDGSSELATLEIESYCSENGYKYLYLNTRDLQFSLSRARNAGIQEANGEWIGFEDADLVYSADHYIKINNVLNNLKDTPFNFITVPIIYLKEEISNSIKEIGTIDDFVPKILNALHFEDPKPNDDNVIIESFAQSTSVIFARKKEILSIGAFDEDFSGWGGEDRDFAFKLLLNNKQLEKPLHFEKTYAQNLNDVSAFEGWRSLYKVIGTYMQNLGIYGYHLFHEKLEWRTDFSKLNIDLAKEKAYQYTKKNILPMQYDKKRKVQLVLGFNPHIYNLQIIDTLPNPYFIEENGKILPDKYIEMIKHYDADAIILWNPYGTPWRLSVYKILVEQGFNVIVAERGALPNSIYYDQDGLCVESTSYDEIHWNRELSAENRDIVENYLADLRYGVNALEKQANRCGAAMVRIKLNIDKKKVLFCPLQLSDDTVTTYFSEPDRGYSEYLQELRKISTSLSDDWVLVYKNHPLSLEKFEGINAICADNFHINDLIELSSMVSVFNSGVGLIAQAFMKPVLYYGACFYKIDGVNFEFINAQSVLKLLNNLEPINGEKVRRFYSYLINEFYSFASWDAVLVKKNSISKVSKASNIEYHIVRIPGYPEKHFNIKVFELKKSILFNNYKFYDYNTRNKKPNAGGDVKKIVQNSIGKTQLDNSKKTNIVKKVSNRKFLTKFRKLKNNPYAFFNDAKNQNFRKLRVLFEK